MAIGHDAEPIESDLKLLNYIYEEENRINIPDNWIFRKVFKADGSGMMKDGHTPFHPNSWAWNSI